MKIVETTFLACEVFTSGFRKWLKSVAFLSSPIIMTLIIIIMTMMMIKMAAVS